MNVQPQPGPQELFLASDADIAIYAGAAYSGKTFAGLLSLAMGVHLPGYGAIAFRRTQPELSGAGSIWTESKGLYPSLGGTARKSPFEWTFPSGATVEMRSLQYEDDVTSHQSKRYAQILFEELTTFTEQQFWSLHGRRGTTCGVQPFTRATCNPEDNWVRGLISWFIDQREESPTFGQIDPARSGVLRWFVRDNDGNLDWSNDRDGLAWKWKHLGLLPQSLTAVRATLDDNVAVGQEARDLVRAGLQSLDPVNRRRKLYGDWNARAVSGTLFRRGWFPEQRDASPVVKRVRAWDKAASPVTSERRDPDWTRGVLLAQLEDGRYLIEDIVSLQGTPGQVDDLMLATARADGKGTIVAVWQDPGQAGVVDVDHVVRMLSPLGYIVRIERAAEKKTVYAEVWSPLAERGRVLVPPGCRWLEAFFREVESFPSKEHDDIVDATSLAFRVIGTIISAGALDHRSAYANMGGRSYEGETIGLNRSPKLGGPSGQPWQPGMGKLPKRYE